MEHMDLDFILSYSYNKIPFPFRKANSFCLIISLIDLLFIDVETLFEGNAVFHDLGFSTSKRSNF